MRIRHLLLASTAGLLLSFSAHAADTFKPGEDSRFSWKSFDDFKAAHKDRP